MAGGDLVEIHEGGLDPLNDVAGRVRAPMPGLRWSKARTRHGPSGTWAYEANGGPPSDVARRGRTLRPHPSGGAISDPQPRGI